MGGPFRRGSVSGPSAVAVVAAGLMLVVGLALLPAGVAQAELFTVDSLDDNTDDDGACTLREAILTANDDPATDDCGAGSTDDDTIEFSVSGPITLSSSLPVIVDASTVGALTIDGAGEIAIDVVSDRIFEVASDADLTLERLTVADGFVSVDGGGIFNEGTLTITDSTLEGNSADKGGGIWNIGTLTIANSTLADNFSDSGGGIYNSGNGTVTITNSTLDDNSGFVSGGGITNHGTMTITNSTLFENSAEDGGGIWNSGTLTITNSTLADNSADDGGGIRNDDTLTIKNSIVANSTSGGDCFNNGTFNAEGDNLDSDGTCPGFSLPNTDPDLDPDGLADNGGPTETIALLASSPAVDAATDCTGITDGGSVTEDQRGVSRPQGAECDLGAYEQVLLGDANADGNVDVIDGRICLQIAEGVLTGTTQQRQACDVNGDGDVTRVDAEEIGKHDIRLPSAIAAGFGLSVLLGLGWGVVWRRREGGERG